MEKEESNEETSFRMSKLVFWIFVGCFIVASLYQGYRIISYMEHYKEKWELSGVYIQTDILSKNESNGIFTLEVTGGSYDFYKMRWVLKKYEGNETIEVHGIKVDYEKFSDNNLPNDLSYQLYWYDSNNNSLLDKSDYLKVRVPNGECLLCGGVEIGRFESGDTAYFSILIKNLSFEGG